jgi:hypothetical protein
MATGDQRFTFLDENDGTFTEVDLCSGGSYKQVNLLNYKEYVALVERHCIDKDSLQMKFFSEGFYKIVPREIMQ